MGGELGPMSDGHMEMRFQRHDEHIEGHLTPNGVEHATEVAKQEVAAYLDKNLDTHFMVIASDQVFDEREPEVGGVRAKQTAEIIAESIRSELFERKLPAEQLFGHKDRDAITVSPNIREADIFNNGFMATLRTRHGEQGAWAAYYQDVDHDDREKAHAESSKDVAQRMDYMLKVAEMVGASFHKAPGKEDTPLVVWLVGHGGGIDSFLHQYAGVPIDEVGFAPSEGFTIRVDEEGQVVADVKGKVYPILTDENMSLPQ